MIKQKYKKNQYSIESDRIMITQSQIALIAIALTIRINNITDPISNQEKIIYMRIMEEN